jgi:hypothetical protein
MSRRWLIFVPEINPRTFVFFFFKGASGRSYSIRDYTVPGVATTRQADYPYGAEEILSMAGRPGCFQIPAEAVHTDETAYWLAQIQAANQKHLGAEVSPDSTTPPPEGAPIALPPPPAPSQRGAIDNPPDDAESRESGGLTGLIDPDQPFSADLKLRRILREARGQVCWFDRFLDATALEYLADEIQECQHTAVRLLSGPQALTRSESLESRYKKLKSEFQSKGIGLAWLILPPESQRRHHDRFLISDAGAFNIPPIRSLITRPQTAEITRSDVTIDLFDQWCRGTTPVEDIWDRRDPEK